MNKARFLNTFPESIIFPISKIALMKNFSFRRYVKNEIIKKRPKDTETKTGMKTYSALLLSKNPQKGSVRNKDELFMFFTETVSDCMPDSPVTFNDMAKMTKH